MNTLAIILGGDKIDIDAKCFAGGRGRERCRRANLRIRERQRMRRQRRRASGGHCRPQQKEVFELQQITDEKTPSARVKYTIDRL